MFVHLTTHQLKDGITLQLLIAGGVCNWEWYSESIGAVNIDNLAVEALIKYIS